MPPRRRKGAAAPNPWAAILDAGAALLQGLASARSASGAAPGAAPFAIERDPVNGQASVRLPLLDPQRYCSAWPRRSSRGCGKP
jgi:hypothetical protein